MRPFTIILLLLLNTISGLTQEQGIVVRYDFSKSAKPPDKPFYLKLYVDGNLVDSTPPHSPSHNLANKASFACEAGWHEVFVEGIVIEKTGSHKMASTVLEWRKSVITGKRKFRIVLKLGSLYEIKSLTINE